MTYNVFSAWNVKPCSIKAFGPCKPTTQTAPQSVQPSLHRRPRSVCIVYNGLPVSPSKLPLPMLASGPHVICGSMDPPESGTQMVTWSFQPFLQSSLVWHTDRATERATDRSRYSVQCGVIMRNYVEYGKANNFATIKSLSVHSKHIIKVLFKLVHLISCIAFGNPSGMPSDHRYPSTY